MVIAFTQGRKLNRLAGVDMICNFVLDDFVKMPFSNNTFDVVFTVETTCHAPNALDYYKRIYRVLKFGQYFSIHKLCISDRFDPMNREHQRIKREVEPGNGLPNIKSVGQSLEALKLTGFEVLWEKDVVADSPLPCHLSLDTTQITRNMVKALEIVGLTLRGS